MILRRKPGDFLVEEICDLKPNDHKDNFKLFLAEKIGIDTLQMIAMLARLNGVPKSSIAYSGLKDRHAITRQYLAIPGKYDLNKSDQSTKINFVGYIPAKLRLGDHVSNKFIITVRDITKGDLESIYQRADSIEENGAPNYFDSQRFGSFHGKESIGKSVLRRDFSNAVRLHCINGSSSEPNSLLKERNTLDKNWNNLTNVKISSISLKNIIDVYKKTGDWLKAYLAIEPKLRELYLAAYQSYFWNECIKTLIYDNSKKTYSVPYKAGNLLFYNGKLELNIGEFPTISDQMMNNPDTKKIIDKIMTKEQITMDDLNLKELTGNFLKSYNRKIILNPKDFKISKPEEDEFYKNRFKVRVEFSLPTGSYATIIIKRIFGQ